MLDVFELAKKFDYIGIIFFTEAVLFIREKDQLVIYQNSYYSKLKDNQQGIFFTAELPRGFRKELLSLLEEYGIFYSITSKEEVQLEGFPYKVVLGIIGDFSYQKV